MQQASASAEALHSPRCKRGSMAGLLHRNENQNSCNLPVMLKALTAPLVKCAATACSPIQLTFQTFAQVGTVRNFMSFTVIILGWSRLKVI